VTDKKYLRGRPFLIVNFSTQPRPGADTRVKGWQSDPKNLKTLEHVSIVDRVGNKQMSAALVIDIIDGAAIRNLTGKENEDVISHYIGRYAEMIKEALHKWAQDQISKGMVEQAVEKVDAVKTEDFVFPPVANGRATKVETLPEGVSLDHGHSSDERFG
jgi:hypothetical protein